MTESRDTGYVDVNDNWQTIAVPPNGLVFTWCQVPVVYELNDDAEPSLTISWDNGEKQTLKQLALPAEESAELFKRSGRIRKLNLNFRANMLFAE